MGNENKTPDRQCLTWDSYSHMVAISFLLVGYLKSFLSQDVVKIDDDVIKLY
jgi:hypothetical protein